MLASRSLSTSYGFWKCSKSTSTFGDETEKRIYESEDCFIILLPIQEKNKYITCSCKIVGTQDSPLRTELPYVRVLNYFPKVDEILFVLDHTLKDLIWFDIHVKNLAIGFCDVVYNLHDVTCSIFIGLITF